MISDIINGVFDFLPLYNYNNDNMKNTI